MISWFKKHFIPHTGNDHKPHFLRKENTRNILIAIIFIEVIVFLTPFLIQINKTGGMAAVLPSILSDLTNEERQTNQLNTLTVNPILNKAAEMKANDMATKSYFAHTSPEGITPWYWLIKAGYQYQYAGENLAVNFTDSKDVTKAWMASPTHKKNIVKGNYTEIGTGIATGIYNGRETIFVAQVYANPIPKTETTTIIQVETNTSKETVAVKKEIKKPDVLGAEVVKEIEKPNITEPKVIKEVEETKTVTTEVPQVINESVKITKPTLLQKMFASPRNTTNTILFTILGIIIMALLINIIMRLKHLHLDLLTNGLLVIAILGAIFVINYYLSYKDVVLTQSLDYSNQDK